MRHLTSVRLAVAILLAGRAAAAEENATGFIAGAGVGASYLHLSSGWAYGLTGAALAPGVSVSAGMRFAGGSRWLLQLAMTRAAQFADPPPGFSSRASTWLLKVQGEWPVCCEKAQDRLYLIGGAGLGGMRPYSSDNVQQQGSAGYALSAGLAIVFRPAPGFEFGLDALASVLVGYRNCGLGSSCDQSETLFGMGTALRVAWVP
jgi:hypothetical protein